MASRDELNALRKLARSRHRAATRKVSRLKAKSDVSISGTDLDPRRDLGNLKKYNAKQLQAYIGQLNKFTSRDVSYVAGAEGKPLSGALWKQYQTMQSALNRRNAKPFEDIKDIFIPSAGMTAGQLQGMKPEHPVTGNPASRAPHIPVSRSSKGLPNDKQLRKLIKDTEKKLSKDYTDKVLNRDRKTLNKMLKDVGQVAPIADIRKDTKNLTKGQYNFLWNYTNFASIASFEYQIARSKVHDPTAMAQFDAAFDTQLREMRKLLGDVKKLDL